MAEDNRSLYLQALSRVVAHPNVALAFAEGAARHRRLEADFNERLIESCPAPEALSFPHMQLSPQQYWERNFFSILFLSIFDAVGIPEERQHLYGMILHAVRGIVTATDNILDDEAKGSVRLSLRGGKVLPNVLVTLMETSVMHDVLQELCVDRAAVMRTRKALHGALYALGAEESGEEDAIEDVFEPKQLLDQIHRFRGGGLLLLAFVAPELNEPRLAREIRLAKSGVNHIGLALQIIDDLSDFQEDLRRRNHNMLRSWIVWNKPDGKMTDGQLKELSDEVLSAPERHFPRATQQVLSMAIEMALEGFARLHDVGHPATRVAAQDLIGSMFRLRGLERLWALYPHDEPSSPQQRALEYAQYFPQ